MLPLLGEEIPEEKLQAYMELVDEDGNGSIEFEEFSHLLKRLADPPVNLHLLRRLLLGRQERFGLRKHVHCESQICSASGRKDT